MRTPERGASTVVYLASSPEVEGITARYWANLKPKPSSKRSFDVDAAQRLWTISEVLTGLPAGP